MRLPSARLCRKRFNSVSISYLRLAAPRRHPRKDLNVGLIALRNSTWCPDHATMTDSPAVQAPLDPKEQPILDRILIIRDKLSLLKQDKSSYIKSHDVLQLYDQLIKQVHLLNVLREEQDKPLEQNRGASP